MTWTAKASFSSQRSMSSRDKPQRLRSFGTPRKPVRCPFRPVRNRRPGSRGKRACREYLMSRQRAGQLDIPYKLVFRGFQVAGCEPDEMGIGPVFAVPKLLNRCGLRLNDIDLWELNEAFAVQVIYCRDRLGIDPEKLNVNGGSIAIGHPFGMT